VNILLAFVIVKFLLYPGIGLLMGTDYPVVAVMSGSMEHDRGTFDSWWFKHGEEYSKFNITKEQFKEYKFVNGFSKGDLIVAYSPKNINIGDVIIFTGDLNYPLIHRIILFNGTYNTKGDNNIGSRSDEININKNRVLGKAIFRVPYVGWLKILFMRAFGYNI
jgi:hypothetical protein